MFRPTRIVLLLVLVLSVTLLLQANASTGAQTATVAGTVQEAPLSVDEAAATYHQYLPVSMTGIASASAGEVQLLSLSPVDPETFRQALLAYIDYIETTDAGIDGVALREQIRGLTVAELEAFREAIPNPALFLNAVSTLTAVSNSAPPDAAPMVGSPSITPQYALPPLPTVTAPFTPAYNSPFGPAYDTWVATLPGFGLLLDTDGDGNLRNERCDTNAEAEQQLVLASLQAAQLALDYACEVAIISPFACPVAAAAAAAVLATEITIAQCSFQDGLVDAIEIETTYENSRITIDQIDRHDAELLEHESDLANHDVDIKTALTNHDVDIKTDLAAHDLNIDTDLAAHDLNIDTDLAAHDLNIDTDLANHDAFMRDAVGQVQTTLDEEMERRIVHMQVIELFEKRSYLLVTSESGQPVPVIVDAVMVSAGRNPSFVDVTANATFTPVGPGLTVVDLDLPPQMQTVDLFAFQVTHDDVVDHYGFIVFDRRTINNVGTGN